ncbi:hypothetical protein ACIBCH_14760 [Amycolatopsis thailandensis]|uniref:hypothetical protein n=1 Tax=Amycolatopsis thailandensis TaxID=589330 RepID=UPI0037A6236E
MPQASDDLAEFFTGMAENCSTTRDRAGIPQLTEVRMARCPVVPLTFRENAFEWWTCSTVSIKFTEAHERS